MNRHCVPDFALDQDYSALTMPNNKSAMDHGDIMELLWQDGQVVLQSQNQRPNILYDDDNHHHREDEIPPPANIFTTQEGNEITRWHNYPLDDFSLCRQMYADDFLYNPPTQLAADTAAATAPMPPPSVTVPPKPPPPSEFQSFPHVSKRQVISSKTAIESAVVDSCETPAEERVSCVSGGNLVVAATDTTSSEGKEREHCELTATSSMAAAGDRKRAKCRDEDVDFEHGNTKKQARGSRPSKRSRAAEVHNLSERRRRDRINEKMKTLQELIPRCNKSDKASMLDEAIQYLKSLQLQLQMMSMGCSMVPPMMFPGVQQCMSPMSMGMGMGVGVGMDVGLNMNRSMAPYPSILPCPALPPSAAASVAHMSTRFPVSAFHMQPVPGIQAINCSDTMMASFLPHNANQQRFPSFADLYRHYISLQQTLLPLHQNQATEVRSASKPSSSKDVGNPEHHQAG